MLKDDICSWASQSEHYPIRQWHTVRNKVFVLGDLKIRIVFPLNQWAVYFTAMNNALALQTFPSSLSDSVLSGVYSASTVQCLKCFQTFALHNKVKILIILPSSVSFSLNDVPSSTGERRQRRLQTCRADPFFSGVTQPREIHLLLNALWVTSRRERGAWMWPHRADKLSLFMGHATLFFHLYLYFSCPSPLQHISSIH